MGRIAVIGSGAAGLTAAVELARGGHLVTVFESGPAPDDRVTDALLSGELRRSLIETYRRPAGDHVTVRTGRLSQVRDWVGWTSSQVGGGTAVWGGLCGRPARADFARWNRTGLSYEEFQPWFADAESLLGVRSPSVCAPPAHGGAPGEAAATLARSPWRFHPAPLAETARIRWGLEPPRRLAELWPWRQAALAARLGVEIRTETRITALELDERAACVRALVAMTKSGRCEREGYEAFVLACGAIQTVRLLLLSGADRFSTASARLIGRYMSFHTFGPRLLVRAAANAVRYPLVTRRPPDELRLRGFVSVHSTGSPGRDWAFAPESESEQCLDFRYTGEDQALPGNRVVLNHALKDACGLPTALVVRPENRRDRRAHGLMAAAISKYVAQLWPQRSVVRSSTFAEDWSRVGDHQMGGCRMSPSAAAGVTRPDGRMHDLANAYVVDASTFPTALPVPPTVAVVANALRVARGL